MPYMCTAWLYTSNMTVEYDTKVKSKFLSKLKSFDDKSQISL